MRSAGGSGAARAPRGASGHPPPQVPGNRSMEVSHGGAGCHVRHPRVTDGLVRRQTGGGVDLQEALDEVLGEVGD